MPDIDNPAWWDDVSGHLGALVGIAIDHPGKGLQRALDGDYVDNDGNPHGGLSDWCRDHPGSTAKE